jgi:opacity protein-like surface antigen
MKKYLGPTVAVALALAVTASPMVAQLMGNPVYAPGGSGLTLALDHGAGLNDASGKTDFFGGRAELGLPIIRLGAGFGVYDTKVAGADKETALAGNVALQILGGPVLPVSVSLFAGVGYLKTSVGGSDQTSLSVPIGLALSVNIPTPGFSIDPWVAPRLQITRTSDITSDTDVNFGLTGGLGAHVALDYVVVSAPTGSALSSSDLSPVLFGIGIHYTISLPGVPIIPGV